MPAHCLAPGVGARAPWLTPIAHPKHLLAEFLLDLNLFFIFILILLFFITLKTTHGVHCDEVVLVLASRVLLERLQLPRGVGKGLRSVLGSCGATLLSESLRDGYGLGWDKPQPAVWPWPRCCTSLGPCPLRWL